MVEQERLGELPGDPESHQRQRLREALPQRAGGVRPGTVELGRESLEPLLGEVRVGERPRAADLGQDLRPVALGKQVSDISLLVTVTPMHQRLLAEHVLDRPAQGLPAVNDEQDRLLGIEPRSTKSASSERARFAFSVEPSHSPSGIFTPSVVIPSATTCVRSAMSIPSSIITARRTSSSRRPISS